MGRKSLRIDIGAAITADSIACQLPLLRTELSQIRFISRPVEEPTSVDGCPLSVGLWPYCSEEEPSVREAFMHQREALRCRDRPRRRLLPLAQAARRLDQPSSSEPETTTPEFDEEVLLHPMARIARARQH